MALQRWAPALLRSRLGSAPRRRADGPPETVDVAVLWLDISGFTPLTRAFAEQGPRGAEIVSGILDRCYGALTSLITDAGGDVVDFAGDGILAVWPADIAGDADSLSTALRAAHACAEQIQQSLDRFPAADGVELRFYAGLAAGTLAMLDVGGEGGRWRFLLTGEPLREMGEAKSRCKAGEVVLSPGAAALLSRANDTRSAPTVPTERTATPDVRADLDEALRPYLLDTVLRRVDAGQGAWLAEFRLASLAFIVIPSPVLDVDTTRAMREAVRSTQARVEALGGSLNQVIMDDTGLVMLAAWGVPDHTHEDDARRAMQAAMDARDAIAALALPVRAGVATGRVFCGACGDERRSRYAIVGAAVNRAARIAMASAASARCDARTYEGANRWMQFAADEQLSLKGLAEPVQLYRPLGAREAASDAGATSAVSGRARERAVLADALAHATPGSGPPLLIIEGEAGIGKSVLLRDLVSAASNSGRRVFVGAADAVERSTSYFPWREPFRALFGVRPGDDHDEARAKVTAMMRPVTGREDRLPLLDTVLRLGWPDTETTAAMRGVDRGVATRDLLADAFDLLAGDSPVLILDDAHWFDSASLELVATLRARVPRTLVAIGTRPPGDDSLPQFLELLALTDTVRIPLTEMSGDDVLTMVRSALGVETLPAALAEFLVQRGEGHPLFTMELALLLRELGVVQVDGRVCTFAADDPRLAALTFSEKAEGVVATRIDQLTPSHQLALKVAAVVGRAFEFQLVRGVYPIAGERPELRRVLDDLTRPRLIEQERPDPTLSYLFRHVVIREVAYGLVSYAQRRQLHGEVARALESVGAADESAQLPLLAHHWLLAEEPGHAIRYLERACRDALHRGAGREALRFVREALSLAERERDRLPELTDVKLAELERLTGEATEQLLDLPESSRWLRKALARLGYDAPDVGDAGRRRAVVRQVVTQLRHLIWPDAWRPRPDPSRAASLELAARAFGTLAEHCYFESDVGGMFLFSLTSVNCAERAKLPAAAERSYVTLAHTAGLAGVTPLLHRYRARSANTTLGRNMAFREIEVAGRTLAHGRMDDAAAAGERAAHIAHRFADRHHEAQGWGAVVSAKLRLGEVDAAIEAAEKIFPTGHLDWALAGRCNAMILAGRPDGALERYAAIDTWEPAFALSHCVARALWSEACGDEEESWQRAETALATMEGPGLKNAFTTGHFANLLALHSRWYHRAVRDGRSPDRVVANVRRLHAELQRHARVIHIGRPRLAHAAALLALHDGQRSVGARHLARGVRIAESMRMAPEVVGLLLEQIRWNLPGAADARSRALALCTTFRLERLRDEVAQA